MKLYQLDLQERAGYMHTPLCLGYIDRVFRRLSTRWGVPVIYIRFPWWFRIPLPAVTEKIAGMREYRDKCTLQKYLVQHQLKIGAGDIARKTDCEYRLLVEYGTRPGLKDSYPGNISK